MCANIRAVDEILFEIIESNRLTFFTGSGSSAGLKNLKGEKFPSWLELLKEIRRERERLTGLPPHKSLGIFLTAASDGPMLVEAASILREGFETHFDAIVSDLLTPAIEEKQEKEAWERHIQRQDLLLSFHPRGIVTVNVDELHENHLERRLQKDWNFSDPLQAKGDETLRKALREIDEKSFLIKAHGTCKHNIAFDFGTYRRLLSELPIYQTFMINLFTNFRVVFLGFSLSDLDFDLLLQSQALTFGDPINQHVALVKRTKSKARLRRAELLSRRFGILCRWYNEHSEIPSILERAQRTPGKKLQRVIQQCLTRDQDERVRAHLDLDHLGDAGKHVAVLSISEKIRQGFLNEDDNWYALSEFIYTLGKIDPPLPEDRLLCRKVLLEALQQTKLKEVAAHAILALDKLADNEDLGLLEKLHAESFWQGLRVLPRTPDKDDRIPVYLLCLIYKIRARKTSPKKARQRSQKSASVSRINA